MSNWKTVAAFRHEDGIDFSILLERKEGVSFFRIRVAGSDDPNAGEGQYLFEETLGHMALSCALRRLSQAVAMFCEDENLPTEVQIAASRRCAPA